MRFDATPCSSLRLLHTLSFTSHIRFLPLLVLIMGSFFRTSRFDGRYFIGANTFCEMEDSPAVRVLLWLFRELADENSDFWSVVRDTTGWDSEKYRYAASMAVRVMCALWFRLVVPFTLWPWRLWRIFSPKSSEELRATTGAEFEACSDCCLEPGFGRQIRQCIRSWRDLRRGQFPTIAQHIFKFCATTNIQNEDRFARQNTYAQAAQGKASNPTSICSQHVIAESTAWHRLAVQQFVNDNLDRLVPEARQQDQTYTALWNAWLATHKLQGNTENHDKFTLEMTDPDKRRRIEAMVGPSAPRAANAAVSEDEWASATPYSIGCEKYSLSMSRIGAVAKSVAQYAAGWGKLVGELLGTVDNLLDVDMGQCCEQFGIGRCEKHEAQQDELAANRRYLWAVSKLPNPKLEHGWLDLVLVHIECLNVDDPDTADADELLSVSRFFFVGLSLFNPIRQVFWELEPKGDNPAIGPWRLHFVHDGSLAVRDLRFKTRQDPGVHLGWPVRSDGRRCSGSRSRSR